LPAYWTPVFGHQLALADLRVLVCRQRLVALLGPGGNGKTRMAVAIAAALAAAQPPVFERIAFVSLIDCVSVAQFWNALAQALGMGNVHDASAQVIAALAHQPSLLVLSTGRAPRGPTSSSSSTTPLQWPRSGLV
jgi:ABC-type uncharacterized transport system ATPase subunit